MPVPKVRLRMLELVEPPCGPTARGRGRATGGSGASDLAGVIAPAAEVGAPTVPLDWPKAKSQTKKLATRSVIVKLSLIVTLRARVFAAL